MHACIPASESVLARTCVFVHSDRLAYAICIHAYIHSCAIFPLLANRQRNLLSSFEQKQVVYVYSQTFQEIMHTSKQNPVIIPNTGTLKKTCILRAFIHFLDDKKLVENTGTCESH